MTKITLAVAVLLFVIVGVASAQVVGDIASPNNDLSWMISVSRPYDGTNADLDGRLTDTLPCDVRGAVYFRGGTYPAGWYRGTLRAGDFVFYTLESKSADGEWRRITHAGRCGNPATGKYFQPERVRVETVQSPPVTTTITSTTTVVEAQLVPVPEIVVQRETQVIETPVRVPVYLCPPARYVPGAAVAVTMDNGGLRFAGVHESDRVQIGTVWGSMRTYRSSTTCPPTPPPPGDGTCGPGTPPTPPPPNDPGVVAPPGDPSGQVPCPPPSDPNAPPAQPDHGTGGQPWEPGPDHPNVADPVAP